MGVFENYLLHLADNQLILGQRLSEWCGHGPALEEDIALSNFALDNIGQATFLYKHLAGLEGSGKSEDDFAFLRSEREYFNFIALELPNGDYAFTIARQYLFAEFYALYLAELSKSKETFLSEYAVKSLKELKYHVQHARDWVLRMGDGTEESKSRIQNAVNQIWNYTGEWFLDFEADEALRAEGIVPKNSELFAEWQQRVQKTFLEATLVMPLSNWSHSGGREGKHSEHMGHLLTPMQYLQRSFPNSNW
jgi:ring-1,2-phenylacetyl-CoA epoxidase subunit PaaC